MSTAENYAELAEANRDSTRGLVYAQLAVAAAIKEAEPCACNAPKTPYGGYLGLGGTGGGGAGGGRTW